MNKKLSAELEISVPFYDIDPMNVVWHGNYVKYLEESRCNFFKELCYTYEDMKNDGIIYPVAKMELKFVKSAYFGQKLRVICTLDEIEPGLIFKYIIKDSETKETICSAKTLQMGVDINTKETVFSICENFKRKINEYKNKVNFDNDDNAF